MEGGCLLLLSVLLKIMQIKFYPIISARKYLMRRDKTSELLARLRSTLSKMELSLGAIDDAIIWIDKQGIIQWCNGKFSDVVQQPHIAILGKSIYELLHLQQKNKSVSLKNILINKIENKNEFQSNVFEMEKNNENICFEISSKPFYEVHEEVSFVVLLHDVTEKQRAQQRIEFLASIPENNSAPILSINKNKRIIYANKAAEFLLDHWKYEFGQALPINFVDLIDLAIKNQKEYLIEETCHEIEYLFSITPGSFDYVNIYGTNITACKEAEKELVYLSNHDMLTNLYNRPAFETALKNEIAKSYKNNTSFAVLLLDLDNFKTVNDTFGHHIGDKLLVNIARQLQENVRKDDIVARLGGG